jgi:hypothetical protein
MNKTIRPTLPMNISFGIVVIIFAIAFFLSGQLFETHQPNLEGFVNLYFGEFLVSTAVIIVVIILWEEILFPVKVKPSKEGLIFRNHRTKLLFQILVYLVIPVIVVFLYLNFVISPFYFYPWAIICVIAPVAGKLVSGINNYNDYLRLTDTVIAYKNNEKVGDFAIKDIKKLTLIQDETKVLHKVQLDFSDQKSVTIDLDEMELEVYCETIEAYIKDNYKSLL